MNEAPNIAQLAEMEDQELMDVLGLSAKLKEAKAALDKMVELKGKAREYAEKRIKDMLTPRAYPDEFTWILDEAKRKEKGGKEELSDAEPASIM